MSPLSPHLQAIQDRYFSVPGNFMKMWNRGIERWEDPMGRGRAREILRKLEGENKTDKQKQQDQLEESQVEQKQLNASSADNTNQFRDTMLKTPLEMIRSIVAERMSAGLTDDAFLFIKGVLNPVPADRLAALKVQTAA